MIVVILGGSGGLLLYVLFARALRVTELGSLPAARRAGCGDDATGLAAHAVPASSPCPFVK